MKIILIYPPLTNPRTPHLSLPALSAYLKTKGYEIKIRDLNLDFFYESLNEEALAEAYLDLEEREAILNSLQTLQKAKAICLDESTPAKERKEAKKRLKWAYDRLFKKHEANVDLESISQCISMFTDEQQAPLTAFYGKRIIPWLQKENPDLVGISVPFPSQLGPSFSLARTIKQTLPHIHITLGGPQITKLASDLACYLKIFTYVDSLVVFEGEKPLMALLSALKESRPLSVVPNLIFRKDDRIVFNPTTDPEPLNQLPTPDFRDLHLGRYLLGELMIPLITSRGCYWGKCSFCTYREIHKQVKELRDPSLVVKDLKFLSEKYQCKIFRIVDDALPPKSCRALSTEILAAGLDIRWKCSARLEKTFTPDLCRVMARAGCYKVMFGLESYNQRVLNLMKKGIRVAHIKSILKNFKDAGIQTHVSCMTGFPTETKEEAEETRRFLETNRDLYTTWGVQTFSLEGGTEIDRHPEKFGITRVFRKDRVRHGLRYGYRFEAESGMSWDEAEEITRKIQDKT
jgi:radical SAM superfamily enzyme YgiQ (UPF0313 family)